MPDARDVILKHIAAVNDRDSAAEPWAADAELLAPGGHPNGRDEVVGFVLPDRSSESFRADWGSGLRHEGSALTGWLPGVRGCRRRS